jgi:hypothetical protein
VRRKRRGAELIGAAVADNPVEAFGENGPALPRLRDDENRQQRPLRLIEVEGEGDQQGDQPRMLSS